MARHRNKFTKCPNCETTLREHDHFCPHCGQENHGLKVPFRHLFLELFESVFHFETKFFTTLKVIFTHPGQITLDFWEGKRARYMHPFRLYLFVSVLFFLSANKVADERANEISKSIDEVQNNNIKVAELNDLVSKGKWDYDDSLLKSKTLSGLGHIDISLPVDPVSRRAVVVSLKKSDDTGLDSLLYTNSIAKTADHRTRLKSALNLIPDATDIPTQMEMGPIRFNFKTLAERDVFTRKIKTFSNQQIDSLLESMKMNRNTFNRTLIKQFAKINASDNHSLQEITHVFMKNLSVIMFVLMPVVAFLLLLVFYGQKRFYFEHLIFSIHAHTILFLVCAFALAIDYFWPAGWLLNITFFLNWIYFFISLKTVFNGGWLAAFLKFILLSILYLVIVLAFLTAAFLWGFMTF